MIKRAVEFWDEGNGCWAAPNFWPRVADAFRQSKTGDCEVKRSALALCAVNCR